VAVLVELSVVEQRLRAVLEVVQDRLPVTEVAERYGVSRQAVHAWLRRYAAGGLDALADRSHRPASCPHQMPKQVEARLLELRERFPDWGPIRLRHQLATEGQAPERVHGVEAVPAPRGRHQLLQRWQPVLPQAHCGVVGAVRL
jgi:transposase-like protein